MIRKLTLGIVSLGLMAVGAYAQNTVTFVGNGYVILDINGAGDTYYDVNNQGNDTVTPSYDTDNSTPTAFSQTFTINQGQSILLGAQLQTNPSFGAGGGTAAFLGYAITDLAEDNGSFTEMNLPFQMVNGMGNDQFQQLASTSGIDVGSGLAPGNYLLAVYEHATDSNGDSLFNNEGGQGGNNWEAEIVVVPEPGTILSFLSGSSLLGGLMFIRRRRS